MPNPLDQRLARLSRRRRAAAALAALWPALAVAAGAAAASVVLARVGLVALRPALPLVLALAGAIPLALAAVAAARREPRGLVAAHLDRDAGAHGLVMALADLPEGERDPAWSARAAAGLADARHAPWPRRGLLAACVALAVLALAFVIPEHTPPEPVAPPPVDAHFAPVERRLDRLERLGLATPEEVARLRQDLERLREEAREDGMSQAAWDGLDRLDASERQSLEKAEKALAQALAASKTLDAPRAGDPTPEEAQRQAAEERERRRRDRDRLKPKDPDAPEPGEAAAAREAARERLMERLSDERERERLGDLAGALSKLAEQAPGLLPALDPGDLKALERLLDAAKGLDGLDDAALEKLKELLEAAAKAGPGEGEGEGGEPGEGLTPEQIDSLAKALEEGLEAGAARLTSGGADGARAMALAQALAKALGAGRAGHSEGGGPAPLVRGGADPAVAPGATTPLPDGAVVNPDGSVTLSVTRRAPDVTEGAPQAGAAAQRFEAFDADARRAHVAPRHRGAVGRYFETRPEAPPSPAPAPPTTEESP